MVKRRCSTDLPYFHPAISMHNHRRERHRADSAFGIATAPTSPMGRVRLACHLYEELKLDEFWAQRLPPSRKGSRWDLVLQTLCAYRLIDPGSGWRLHRQWFEVSALKDLGPGLTARSGLEKMAAMKRIDVHLPTTDGREVILTRYTQPEPEQKILLEQLKLKLPEQPPPKFRQPTPTAN